MENIKELATGMLEKQDELNSSLDKLWIYKDEQDWDWDAYIIAESAELLESLPLYHWKPNEMDLQNALVETIDIWHFLQSKYMTQYSKNAIVQMIERVYNDNEFISDDFACDTDEQKCKYIKFNIKQLNKHIDEPLIAISCILEIIDTLGYSFEDLYKFYMTKNILNSFRYNNGYKKGEYKKIWLYNDEKVEDNVIAFNIAPEIPLESFNEELYSRLSIYYEEQK